MRFRNVLTAVSLTIVLLASGSNVFAQPAFSITVSVDENGHGTLANTNNFNAPLPFAMLADPGPGGLPSALTYGLLNPPGLTAGDLILLEPGGIGTVSDIIRFNPNQNGGSLVFYSDNSDGVDALADVGFPNALYANNLTVFEVGPEGHNGFTYTPTAGQPGFVAGAGGPVTYVITSDAVPEPGQLALFGVLITFGGIKCVWRRKKAAA